MNRCTPRLDQERQRGPHHQEEHGGLQGGAASSPDPHGHQSDAGGQHQEHRVIDLAELRDALTLPEDVSLTVDIDPVNLL